MTDEENEKLAKANAEESMALAELVAECEKKMEKATAITEQKQKESECVEKILRIKLELMNAVLQKRPERMQPLMRRLEALELSRNTIIETGIGMLLNDAGIWPEKVKDKAKFLVEKCKEKVKDLSEPAELARIPDGQKPFRGMKASVFLSKAESLTESMMRSDHHDMPVVTLLMWGLETMEELAGVHENMLESLHFHPKVKRIMVRMGEIASERRQMRLAKKVKVAEAAAAVAAARLENDGDAQAVASSLDMSKHKEQWTNLQQKKEQAGLAKFEEKKAPRKRLAEVLELAKYDPDKMEEIITESSEYMLCKSRKTAASTASGLRAWHSFAVSYLGYPEQHSLPPVKGADVMKFCFVFNNKGTASNYVGYIKWACNNKGLDMSWYDGQLRQFLQGIENVQDDYSMGPDGAKFLMSQDKVNSSVAYFQDTQDWQMVLATLNGWEFLLRMQSEGLKLWIGKESHVQCMPPDMDATTWIDDEFNLCLRLKVRKNRRHGMTMRRACRCREAAGTGRAVPKRFCATHVFADYVKNKDVGDMIVNLTPHEFSKRMKRTLTLMSVEKAEKFTCKAFRAGRATELVQEGCSLPEILDMGAWASNKGAARYVREEHIDPNRSDLNKFVTLLHQESDEEI